MNLRRRQESDFRRAGRILVFQWSSPPACRSSSTSCAAQLLRPHLAGRRCGLPPVRSLPPAASSRIPRLHRQLDLTRNGPARPRAYQASQAPFGFLELVVQCIGRTHRAYSTLGIGRASLREKRVRGSVCEFPVYLHPDLPRDGPSDGRRPLCRLFYSHLEERPTDRMPRLIPLSTASSLVDAPSLLRRLRMWLRTV